jgi:hypothetical protein
MTFEAEPGFRGDESGLRGHEGGRCVETTRAEVRSRSAIDRIHMALD